MSAFPSLPARNSNDWYAWAQAMHNTTSGIGALLPAHAGTRTRAYDGGLSVYNLKASNTQRMRAMMGAARAGTGLCRVAFAGDSQVSGHLLTRGTNDPTTFARQGLARGGLAVGEMVQPFSNEAGLDPRWAFTGSNATSFTAPNNPWINVQSGGTVTFTGTGTVLEVVTTAYPGYEFTYSIDSGVVTGTIPTGPTATPGAARAVTVTGLSNAAHTVTLTAPSSGMYLYAGGFRYPSGVVVQNAGVVGSSVRTWIDDSSTLGLSLTLFATGAGHSQPIPDVVFLELGINDCRNNDTGTFVADYGTLIERARRAGATVVLVLSNYVDPSAGGLGLPGWEAFMSLVYDVADAKDLPLLDLGDRWGPWTTVNADGQPYDLSIDTGHPTAAAQADKAALWLNTLGV